MKVKKIECLVCIVLKDPQRYSVETECFMCVSLQTTTGVLLTVTTENDNAVRKNNVVRFCIEKEILKQKLKVLEKHKRYSLEDTSNCGFDILY